MSHSIPWWKYFRALAPVVVFWTVLVGWLAMLLTERSRVGLETDEANLHEWIDEARSFRKTLPELVRDYLGRLDENNNDPTAPPVTVKAEELLEQLKALADPVRLYQGQLPTFPEIYRLEVEIVGKTNVRPIAWESTAPRPRGPTATAVRRLNHPIPSADGNVAAIVHCDYRLHAFNKLQRDEARRQGVVWVVASVVLGGSALALVWVWTFLRRERQREIEQLETEAERDHAQMSALAARIHAQEEAQARAEAERANLEMRSQIFASIGIMAGSYAHNIKNLLVRPNDLINRCLEVPGLKSDQAHMLDEVKTTLATVTDRLQMILRTVRRDPTKTEATLLDVNELIREMGETWSVIAREKWKLNLTVTPAQEPLTIQGDHSHLQQAIENLIFNARDATFEMRNHVRDAARAESDASRRKQLIIDAAAWRGEVTIQGRLDQDSVLLEVRDNGIGMTPEVRSRCLETHFSTKRDNALFEGHNAGMGLGLSFVAMVLQHHDAILEIESEPMEGALFRVRFARAPQQGSAT